MEPFEQLEVEFAAWARASNPVACSSGSSALHLAFEALRLPPGSEVLVPEYTMVACARAVTMAGLKPVFVDCDDSLLMDPLKCSRRITRNTRAILAVHVYGRGCDMGSLAGLAAEYDLNLIEDCAEYHGATLSGLADAYCWSFYRNKIVHGEEGGMICFKESEHAQLARLLRCQGFTPAHDFLHVPRGINARLSNANALPILASLSQADSNLQRRAQVVQWYDTELPAVWRMPKRDVCWVYDIQIPGVDLYEVVEALNRFGVAARHGFRPMSQQPEYLSDFNQLNAYRLSKEVFYLPVTPAMTQEEVRGVCEYLRWVVF